MTEQTIQAAFYRGNKSFSVEARQIAAPAAGEVAVRIAYVGICGTDMHVFAGHMDARVGFERVIGHEMSGYVEAVGEGVDGFKIGQPVVVRPLDHCGDCPACDAGHEHICHNLKFLGLDTDGAMQEIWNVPAHTLHILPDDIRMDHAALIELLGNFKTERIHLRYNNLATCITCDHGHQYTDGTAANHQHIFTSLKA